jgi:hypothetical protein
MEIIKLRSVAFNRKPNGRDAIETHQRLPVAGFDVIADQWRAARATLLDAASAGLELG